ncbi:MAG: 50S ribosomal protein L22 [Candidatus Marinimicrobia bacterium]|nr:50S ribosomal protein L22 [Candidatus Neomarinimicrobiota bacterium]
MEAKAISRHIKQSPRKVRMVADLVRGKDVETALNQLHFSNKKASEWIEKTVRSAVSNLMTLEGGAGVSPEDLFVKTILVDAGATVKRFRAGSMGRASIIRKRSSHISVTIAEKKDKVGKNQKKK